MRFNLEDTEINELWWNTRYRTFPLRPFQEHGFESLPCQILTKFCTRRSRWYISQPSGALAESVCFCSFWETWVNRRTTDACATTVALLTKSSRAKKGLKIWWRGSYPQSLSWIHAAVSKKPELRTDGRPACATTVALLTKPSRAKKRCSAKFIPFHFTRVIRDFNTGRSIVRKCTATSKCNWCAWGDNTFYLFLTSTRTPRLMVFFFYTQRFNITDLFPYTIAPNCPKIALKYQLKGKEKTKKKTL